MKEIKKIKEVYKIMKQLSQGIDPVSNIEFLDYELLNHPLLKQTFADVCEYLKLLEKEYYGITGKKFPFKIIDKDAINSIISDNDVIITEFVNKINNVNNHKMMKRLQTKTITSWLMKYGYLREEIVDEKVRRVATKAGQQIGIDRRRLSSNSLIVVNFYNTNAQSYIIKYLENIITDDELNNK